MEPYLNNSGYYFNPLEERIKDIPLSDPMLYSLAYLQHKHDQVNDVGLSLLASFDGRHRSGKSMTALTFGYIWDPTFYDNLENRVVRDHQEFFNAWDKIEKQGIKGAVVQVDEAGVSMASSDWYEAWLKAISKMVQMYGYLNPITLFCAPSKDFIDNRLRRMFHAYYEVKRFRKDYSKVIPYDVGFNTIKAKQFYKHPTVRVYDRDIQIRSLRLMRPPDFLLDKYIALETVNKPEMIAEVREVLRRTEAMKQKQEVDLNKVIEFVVTSHKQFESEKSKPQHIILDFNLLSFYFRVPQNTAKYIKTMSEKRLTELYRIKMEEVGKHGSDNSV